MILLDTQTMLWMAEDIPRIGQLTWRKIEAEQLAVSAISFWEMAMLVEKKRLLASHTPEELWRIVLSTQAFEVPVTGEIGIRAAQLEGFHGDPADRLIVATALHHGATLMTSDKKILAWQESLKSWDVRK